MRAPPLKLLSHLKLVSVYARKAIYLMTAAIKARQSEIGRAITTEKASADARGGQAEEQSDLVCAGPHCKIHTIIQLWVSQWKTFWLVVWLLFVRMDLCVSRTWEDNWSMPHSVVTRFRSCVNRITPS